MRIPRVLFGLLLAMSVRGDVSKCACDISDPASMSRFECGLCRAAEQQPPGIPYFFLKDSNPLKPHRWLILPRRHYAGGHGLDYLSAAERTALWTAAIEKAKSLWGNEWGLAYNGEKARRQCHGHIHIGKLLTGVEEGRFIVVSGPAQIPKPGKLGLWIHPVGNKLHVHLGENITETVLWR